MARPIKDGLSYFPKDTDFYRDRKIRALIGRFGSDGAALYDYILCEIYGDKGYYTEIDQSFVDIAAADLGISPEKIGLILNYLLDKSMLLDGTLFKAVKVLTSHGIQTRYQEAMRKRGKLRSICVDGKLWLLDEAETESFIKVTHNDSSFRKNTSYCSENHSYYGNNSANKIKENKSKVNERKENETCRTREALVSAMLETYVSKVNQNASRDSLDQLRYYAEQMGPEVCLRAFDIALDEKKPQWSYINGILRKKLEQGVTCLDDWYELDKKYKSGNAQNPKTQETSNPFLRMLMEGEHDEN